MNNTNAHQVLSNDWFAGCAFRLGLVLNYYLTSTQAVLTYSTTTYCRLVNFLNFIVSCELAVDANLASSIAKL